MKTKVTQDELKKMVEMILKRPVQLPPIRKQASQKCKNTSAHYIKMNYANEYGVRQKKWAKLAPRPKEMPNQFKRRCQTSSAVYFKENPNKNVKKCISRNVTVNKAPVNTLKKVRGLSKQNRQILRAMKKPAPITSNAYNMNELANALEGVKKSNNNGIIINNSNNNNRQNNNTMSINDGSNNNSNSNKNVKKVQKKK